MYHRLAPSAFLLVGALLLVAGPACEPAPPPAALTLPAGLNLSALPADQQALLRSTLTISGGALNETELALNVADNTVAGEFTLQNIAESSERILSLRVYGRVNRDGVEVLLGEVLQPIAVAPEAAVEVDFGGDTRFETCGAGADGRCSVLFDANRNGRPNIDDLLPESAGGLGIDPAPQAPFLVTSATQLQFPSGVRLGTFARQLVVLENFGEHPVTIVSAAVVGGQGFSLSILDPAGLSVSTPARSLDASSFPAAINPAEESFIAVSFAPVNGFVTTGALFVVAEDTVTRIRQTARVKLIANPEGGLRPADADYVEPVIEGGVLAVTTGQMTVVPFPSGPLHSGEPLTADDVEAGGIPTSGAQLVLGTGADTVVFPADFGFVVDVAPRDRFSTTLDGLTSDVDLAVVVIDGTTITGLVCASCRSSNAGPSPEALEFVNTTTATQRIVIVLGRVDVDGVTGGVVPFRLTATLSRGPEFDAIEPIDPVTGPLEGGLQIRLRGTGFDERARVRVGGAEALDVAITTDDAGQNLVTFTQPAQQGTENPATIVVENPGVDVGGDGQAATLPEGFLFQPPAPVIEELRPDLAPSTGGTVAVTIVGRFFSARHGPPRVLFRDTVLGTTVAVDATPINATTLEVLAPPSSTPTVGSTVQVKVHNRLAPDVDGTDPVLGSASNGLAFRYLVPEGPAPTLVSVTPAEGSIDGGTDVVLAGTGLRTGLVAFFDGVEAPCAPPTATTVSCQAPARARDGVVDIVVFNVDGQAGTLAGSFTYTIPAPAITSIFPARASTLGGTLLVVDGVGFRPGATVAFRTGAGETPATNTTRVSATTMLVTTPAQAAGDVSLVINNVDGQQASGAFTVFGPDAAVPPPSILSVSPGSGDAGGGYDVVIEGQDFRAPRVLFGSTIVSGALDDRQPPENDRLTIVAPPSPTGVAAVVDIQLSNDDGQSASQPFVYTFVAATAPRVDSVTPALLPAQTTTTVVISGQRFDAARARVLIGGVEVPVQARSSTRLTASINTRQLPTGPNSLVVENADGLSTSAAIQVLAPVTVLVPRLLSVSPTSLHARVAGDELVVLGENLDQGTVIPTLRAVAVGGADGLTRVVSRTANVLVLEVPALNDGTHVLELAFADLLPPSVLVSPPIEVNDPVIAFSSLRARTDGTVELTMLGDALNPDALTAVDLVDFGGRVVPCAVSSATEGLVRCGTTTALATGTGYVPRLSWTGTFAGVVDAVSVEGDAIGFGEPVGTAPLDGEPTLIPSNTLFAQLPLVTSIFIPGLDPDGLAANIDVNVIHLPTGDIVATGVAEPFVDFAGVTLTDGALIELTGESFNEFALVLGVGTAQVAVADVELLSRRVSNVGVFGNPNVTWPNQAAAIAGPFVDGDVNRLVAVHPTEAIVVPLTAFPAGAGFRVPSTQVLSIGTWSVCLADQVALQAPQLCRPLIVNQLAAEREANDTDVDATAVALNTVGNPEGIPIAGDVTGVDSDRFFFLATTGVGRVRASLTGVCDPGLTMHIRARDDATVLGTQTASDGCFTLQADLPAVGQYVVEVSGSSPGYSLLVEEIICGDGIVTENESCDDGFVFNGNDSAFLVEFSTGIAACSNTCEEPGEPDDVVPVGIPDSSNTFGTLTADDTDRFAFTLSAPTRFGAGTTLRSGPIVDKNCLNRMRVTLSTAAGEELATTNSGGEFACPFFAVDVPAGDYLITVQAENPTDVLRYKLFTFPDAP